MVVHKPMGDVSVGLHLMITEGRTVVLANLSVILNGSYPQCVLSLNFLNSLQETKASFTEC